jgi:hypothetical protein
LAAPAVLVAERDALDGAGPSEAGGSANSGPFGSAAVSTGWSLWAARRLTRGHTGQAVLVLVIGQGGVAAAMALVPSGSNVLVQALGGVAMISTAFWWALVWEFSAFCIETRAAPARRT